MKIIGASYKILNADLNDPEIPKAIYRRIEQAGRTCYKSESTISDESAERFVRNIVKNGHEAMLEHAFMTVLFTVDRGISHELVRHRLASFAQESTRYCNYSKDKFGNEITVVKPVFFTEDYLQAHPEEKATYLKRYSAWYSSCSFAESSYFQMLREGATPQEARNVLPTSVKTEVVMTANMREIRHFLKLRAAGETGKPHPQMLEVAVPLLNELRDKLPAIFEDITPMEEANW